MLLSGSVELLPLRVTELAGNVMVWSCPACAKGGLLIAGSGGFGSISFSFLQEIKSKAENRNPIVKADKKNFFIITAV